MFPMRLYVFFAKGLSNHSGWDMNYRMMSRFAGGAIFDLPVFDRFDFILKFDGDAIMTAPFQHDPIARLNSNKVKQFAFWVQYKDLESVTVGLEEAIRSFLIDKNLSMPSMIFDVETNAYLRTTFYGCFWAARLSFFRSQKYYNLFRYFDELDGIFIHRWDEQKFFALMVALYLKPENLEFMDYAHVAHQNMVSPQMCCGIRTNNSNDLIAS